MGRGRAAPQAQTGGEARPGAQRGSLSEYRSAEPCVKPGLIMEGGKAEQKPQRGPADDSSPGKVDQFEEMKEELKILKNLVGKLEKENEKVKEDFVVFKEECGANVEMLKNQVGKLEKENVKVTYVLK